MLCGDSHTQSVCVHTHICTVFLSAIFLTVKLDSDLADVLCNYGLGHKSVFMVCDICRPCQRVWCVYVMFTAGSCHVSVTINVPQWRIMGDHTALCCQGRNAMEMLRNEYRVCLCVCWRDIVCFWVCLCACMLKMEKSQEVHSSSVFLNMTFCSLPWDWHLTSACLLLVLSSFRNNILQSVVHSLSAHQWGTGSSENDGVSLHTTWDSSSLSAFNLKGQ